MRLGSYPSADAALAGWENEATRWRDEAVRSAARADALQNHAAREGRTIRRVQKGERGGRYASSELIERRQYWSSRERTAKATQRAEDFDRRLAKLREVLARLPPETAHLSAASRSPAGTTVKHPALPPSPLGRVTRAERRKAVEMFLKGVSKTGLDLPRDLPKRQWRLIGQLMAEFSREGLPAIAAWLGLVDERTSRRSRVTARPRRGQ
jgi:hypothetical protein